MKRALLTVLALGVALAQEVPGFLNYYLTQSPEWSQAVSELELAKARRKALSEDPWAAPFELAEAEDAVLRREAKLAQLRLRLWEEALSLYAAPVVARARLEAAEAALAEAETQAEAARIRHERGAIRESELEAAEEALEAARLEAEGAKKELELAEAALARYQTKPPEAVPELTPPKDLRVEASPELALARLAVRAARRAHDAASGPDTPRAERIRLEVSLNAAQRKLAATQRALAERLSRLKEDYARARETLSLRRKQHQGAAAALEAARIRFQKGLVSELEVKGAKRRERAAWLAQVEAELALAREALRLFAFSEVER